MKKIILSLFVIVSFSCLGQTSETLYNITRGNLIIPKDKFVAPFFVENVTLTPYNFQKTESFYSLFASFDVDMLKFNGYENEPGICNVINIKQYGLGILSIKTSNGFASISSYVATETGDFVFAQVATNTYILVFNEWIYASQPSMVSVVIIKNSQAELVYNKPMFINSITRDRGTFSMELQSNTVEYIGNNNVPTTNPNTHQIWWDGDVLMYQ